MIPSQLRPPARSFRAGILRKAALALLLGCGWGSVAQDPSVEALRAELAPLTGKARLAALHQLVNRIEGRRPQDALLFAAEGLALARREGDPVLEATFLSSQSYCHSLTGEFEQALRKGRESLDLSQRIGNTERIATAHNVLGIAYTFMGAYSQALEQHLESLRLREEYSLDEAAIKSLMNIGVLYHNMGQYEKSITYYNKIIERMKNDVSISTVVQARLNIGFAEIKMGKFEQALNNHRESMEYIKKYKISSLQGYAHLNLGLATMGLGRYDEARAHLLWSLEEYQKQGQKHARVQVLNALGRLGMLTGAKDAAITYAEQAAALARKINARKELMNSYELLSEVHQARHNTAKAFEYYKLYSETKDNIFKLQESDKIADISSKLIILKKDNEITILQKEKTISDYKIKENKRIMIFFVSGIGLLITAVVFLVKYNNKLNTTKKNLEKANSSLETLNSTLQEKVNEIKTLTGLLPICAHCKKIRNDGGYWEQLEGYISEHSSATFTHGICPNCAEQLYPEAARKIAERRPDEA